MSGARLRQALAPALGFLPAARILAAPHTRFSGVPLDRLPLLHPAPIFPEEPRTGSLSGGASLNRLPPLPPATWTHLLHASAAPDNAPASAAPSSPAPAQPQGSSELDSAPGDSPSAGPTSGPASGSEASGSGVSWGEQDEQGSQQQDTHRGSFFWQAAKWGFGSSILATAGACAYVTYAYDNLTIKSWVQQARDKLHDEHPVVVDALKQKSSFTYLLTHPSSWPVAAQNGLVELGQTYVDLREDAEEHLHKFTSPSSDQLLPDLLPQERHVYTLVLDLEGTLVAHEWRRDRGWRAFKRPGVDAFLERMAQFYEIVVFTDQLNIESDPIVDKLDPNRRIRFRLYRDATQYAKGQYVRDLSKLNRDPSRVLYLTANPKSVVQTENMIVLQPWNLESGQDTSLLDLLPFLEYVSHQRPPDTRAVLKSYEDQDIPTAFKERAREYQRRIQERKQSSWLRAR